MYTVVTGAAGFIGANIVKALNERGETNIIAVDNLTKADKFRNLTDCEIADYFDKAEFLDLVEAVPILSRPACRPPASGSSPCVAARTWEKRGRSCRSPRRPTAPERGYASCRQSYLRAAWTTILSVRAYRQD